MVLFWRVFAAVLVPFVLVLGSIAYFVSVRQIDEAEQELIRKIRVLARFTSVKLEAGHLDQNWPVQDLRTLAAERDVLFWWIVAPDRRIHLADTVQSMGRQVDAELPGAPAHITREHLGFRRKDGYGILVLPLNTGARQWSFWVGFSLQHLSEMKRRIVRWTCSGALAALLVLGGCVYFIVRYYLRPIQALAASAEVVGEGDLTHRAQVRTRDELGALAAAFNHMVEELERTTVSRSYADGIMSSMMDAVVVLDSGLRIRTVNRSACQLLGAPEAELIGRAFPDFFECRQQGCDPAAALAGARISNCEAWAASAGGARVPILFSASRMLEGHHEVRIVATARDITELNQMKTELARARDAALASARHKSEFLANMSHEIRTPMNGILGMSELLGATRLTPEQREYLGAVQSSAESLLAIINEILDLSKIDAGKLELAAAPFDLREWYDELLRPLAIRAHQKGLDFGGLLTGAPIATVVADPDRLRQVLINLAGNAIKFTEAGEVELTIEAEDLSNGRVRLCFSVRDTGIGIPAEKQRLIFESFTQADGSISRKYGGTGLGLTISSRLVQMMGGELCVESSPGHGSRFHFALELPATKRSPEAGALAARRVLLADSPGPSLRALERLLTELGAAVTPAHSADDVRALAGGDRFDLALVDARLPGGDIEDVIARLRRAQLVEGPCVLLETLAERQAHPHERALPGVCRRVLKPIRRADLLALAGAVAEPDPKTGDAGSGAARPGDALRVLVVEDNSVNQMVAARLLEGRGHRVRIAGNGEEAIAITAQETFDVILMDIQLPGLDGIETTGILRARERASGVRTPIIALTANAMKGDREKYLAAGMDDYVSKPLRAGELFRAIDASRR